MNKKMLFIVVLSLISVFLFSAVDQPKKGSWYLGNTKYAPVESVSSSSELEEVHHGGKYVYPPAYILDGNFMTCWAEAKRGAGIGQSITIGFVEPISFDEIQIVNGLAGTKRYYYANNRITRIKVSQKAGKHFQQKIYTLRDRVVGWQSIKFEQIQTARSIIFTIMAVKRGRTYNDTCISDIRFLYKGRVLPYRKHLGLIKFQSKMARRKVRGKIKAVSYKRFKRYFCNFGWIGSSKSRHLLTSSLTGLVYDFYDFKKGRGFFRVSVSNSGRYTDGKFYLVGTKIILQAYVSYLKVRRVIYVKILDNKRIMLNGVVYKVRIVR